MATEFTASGERTAVHLTGDALFSFLDARVDFLMSEMLVHEDCTMYIDEEEAKSLGINALARGNVVTNGDFWGNLITKASTGGERSAGFLQLRGPYMNRTTVHAAQFLERATSLGYSPELYLYLDGVHVAHAGQAPSEFDNIGEAHQGIFRKAKTTGLHPGILACTRCATARGYASPAFDEENTKSRHGITECDFVNLNKIVDRLAQQHLVVSSDSFLVRRGSLEPGQPPSIVIFITGTPYGSELAFGGLSLALAAAGNFEIDTSIVFIEDGVFSLVSRHDTGENSKIFNMQDVLIATEDMDMLHYYSFEPSVLARGKKVQDALDFVKDIDGPGLARLAGLGSRDARLARGFLF